MATANQSVTADQLISATVKYSNKDDASRVYDISANVNIQNSNVTSFDNGEVRKVQSETTTEMDGMNVSTFNSYGQKQLNLYISNAGEEEAKLILESVYAFMADVRTSVTSNPVTA